MGKEDDNQYADAENCVEGDLSTILIPLVILAVYVVVLYLVCASTPVNGQLTTIPALGQEISQGNIPSITYEQRGVAREAIRDVFLNRTGLASQIRDHVEDISLESINPAHVNTGGLGIITPDALITSITQSDASPTTRMDAIQAVLRRLASDSNTAMGSGMDTVSATGNLALMGWAGLGWAGLGWAGLN